jgi:hypothetical protein
MRREWFGGSRILWRDQQRVDGWIRPQQVNAEEPVFYWVECIFLLLETSRAERFAIVALESVVGDGIP